MAENKTDPYKGFKPINPTNKNRGKGDSGLHVDTERKIARAMGLTDLPNGQPIERRVWDSYNNIWRYIKDE